MSNTELIRLIKSGINVQDNMQSLYDKNRGIIYNAVKPFFSTGEYVEDLMQQAYFALVNAVEVYDQERNCAFTTLLSTAVQREIVRYINRTNNNIRIPDHLKRLVLRYNKFVSDCLRDTNKMPSEHEICCHLGINETMLQNVISADDMLNLDSLDREISTDSGITEIGEYVADPENNIDNFIDDTATTEANYQLWLTVQALPPKSSKVISMYYKDNMSLSDIAKHYNCSVETIRRIHYDAVKRLKRKIRTLENSTCDIYNIGVKNTGRTPFENSWTSQTENVALKLYKLDKLKECLK